MTTQSVPPPTPRAAYQRVDVPHLAGASPAPWPAPAAGRRGPAPTGAAGIGRAAQQPIRWALIPLSALLCIVQAIATIIAADTREMFLTTALIAIVAFGVLFLAVLAVNPLLGLAAAVLGKWARPLNRAELVCLFSAMTLTAGVSTIGLTEQLIPMMVTPNNPEWNTAQRGWRTAVVPGMNRKLYIQDPGVILTFRHGVTRGADGARLIVPRDSDPWTAKLAYGLTVFRAVPWGSWLPPLGYWLIFVGGCYGLYYSLTYILLGYWADREKLIFPLVRLAEALLPEAGPSAGADGIGGITGAAGNTRTLSTGSLILTRIPVILRSLLFWVGFALTFGVLCINGATSVRWLPPDFTIPLGINGSRMALLTEGTIFRGLSATGTDAHLMCLVIFTAVGIAFLLPLEISFSVWFYYLAGRAVMLAMFWTGRGQSISDFPSDWTWEMNPLTAMGGGGVFLFSGVCLYRCGRDYLRLAAGKPLGQRLAIGVPVLGLAASIAVTTAWLCWNRLPVGWALLFVACITLVTVVLMRVVAEAGIYWFQAQTSFFHIYNILGLGKYLATALVAPLLPIYGVMFLDIKTYLPPSLMGVAHMQRTSNVARVKFHVNLLVSLVVSVVVSLVFAIFLAHLRGGQSMESWCYNDGPPWIMDLARTVATSRPAFDPGTTLWFAGGAAWTALSVVLRTTLFWFPHPIGFIMLINPMIGQLWFSFFLGWVCKRMVVRWGGKATFDRARGFFIGMIMGELMAIAVWTAIAFFSGLRVSGVTLNRYY